MNEPPATLQALAERVRDSMFSTDAAAHALGMRVLSISPGHASVAMTVRADMLNGFAICHGGLVATLADTAFAYACNAHDVLTVASGFSVDLLRPSHEGDRLTAVAREMHKSGRTGLYDVVINNQRGECVAQFRGRSHSLTGRPVIGGAPMPAQDRMSADPVRSSS